MLERLIKTFAGPSTRAFYLEGKKVPGYGFWDFFHGYIYGRWPYFYISAGLGRHPLAKPLLALFDLYEKVRNSRRAEAEGPQGVGFADTYHGKPMPLESARRLIKVNRDIDLGDIGEPILPYARARDIILRHPEHITLLDCPCRATKENPCLPLDVCLIVGEPFAGFILEHHPDRSRRIGVEEALRILKETDERGNVHHAFFKDVMLGRYYAICNCCACCCGAMQAQRNGTPMLTSSGYVAKVDAENCKGCGKCARFCQFDAIQVVKGEAAAITDACMGCGVCVSKCPTGALSLVREPIRGEPLEIERLIAESGIMG